MLGPYRVVEKLGAGGMGEVYKARDTRLDRTVAIKILPSHLATDPSLQARFEREARAIAALDHPHICAIYDVGSHQGTDFIVMQHLDGETLQARLARANGPLPLDEALTIAIDVADALDKAHRAGITHRDIKPANIMLVRSGGTSALPTAKLLDFGLAKLHGPAAPISLSGLTRVATPTPNTAHGTIVGTVHYMAPEQVEGREVDARADIWAFGVVLYQMLTGMRPFGGDTAASVIGAILKDVVPPVSSRQPVAPPSLDHVVARCLEKNRDERWQNAADLHLELQWLGAMPRMDRAMTPSGARVARRAWIASTAALAVVAIALGGLLLRLPHPATADRTVLKFTVTPPSNVILTNPPATVPGPELAVSPDGRWLAFVAERIGSDPMLWLRRIDSTATTSMAGTEGASYPFWAPDSHALAFFAHGKLKRVDVPSGSPQTLCDVPDSRGGAWGRGDMILFGLGGGALQRVSANGGEATTVGHVNAKNGDEPIYRFPSFLPDGRHFLFFDVARVRRDSTVRLGNVDDSLGLELLRAQYAAQFVAPGHLLSLTTTGTLMAQPFDPSNRRLSGEAITIAQDVAGSSVNAASFSASGTGILAYATAADRQTQIAWFRRDGTRLSTVGPPGDFIDVQLSRDEQRLAITRIESTGAAANIVIVDMVTGVQSPLTFESDGHNFVGQPIWSPDGSQIVFRSLQELPAVLFRRSASGASRGEALLRPRESLPEAMSSLSPTDWSPDGRFVIFHGSSRRTGLDLWLLPLTADRKARPFVQTNGNDIFGRFSPDGRFVAYCSDESGRPEIYVQSFPEGDGRWQVSTEGGAEPRWRADGRELFFIAADRRLMAVPVKTGSTFDHGAPAALFPSRVANFANPFRTSYAVSRDGQRFLINAQAESAAPAAITVVANWPELLKK